VPASKNVVAFNAEGTDLPRRTHLLAGVTQDGFTFSPHHCSPPTGVQVLHLQNVSIRHFKNRSRIGENFLTRNVHSAPFDFELSNAEWQASAREQS